MTVEGLLTWTEYRVTAKDRWFRKAYSEKVVAPNAETAMEACKQSYGGITDLIDWQAKVIGGYDKIKVVHMI